MFTGTISCGYEFHIPEERTDDMEMIDAIAGIDENSTNLTKVVDMLIGKEEKKELYEKLRGENGRVKASDVSSAIVEILNACGEAGKN